MWKTEYKKTFLKELSKLPAGIRTRIEKIVFRELICENPFKLGYIEKLKGYDNKFKIRISDYRIGYCIKTPYKVHSCPKNEKGEL
jgi:mRNA interferase RelE/StbE